MSSNPQNQQQKKKASVKGAKDKAAKVSAQSPSKLKMKEKESKVNKSKIDETNINDISDLGPVDFDDVDMQKSIANESQKPSSKRKNTAKSVKGTTKNAVIKAGSGEQPLASLKQPPSSPKSNTSTPKVMIEQNPEDLKLDQIDKKDAMDQPKPVETNLDQPQPADVSTEQVIMNPAPNEHDLTLQLNVQGTLVTGYVVSPTLSRQEQPSIPLQGKFQIQEYATQPLQVSGKSKEGLISQTEEPEAKLNYQTEKAEENEQLSPEVQEKLSHPSNQEEIRVSEGADDQHQEITSKSNVVNQGVSKVEDLKPSEQYQVEQEKKAEQDRSPVKAQSPARHVQKKKTPQFSTQLKEQEVDQKKDNFDFKLKNQSIKQNGAPDGNMSESTIKSNTKESVVMTGLNALSDAGSLQLEIQRQSSQILNLQKKLSAQNGADMLLKQIRSKLKDQVEGNQKHLQEKLALQGEVSSLKMEVELLREQMSTLESTIDDLNESIKERDSEMEQGEDKNAQLKQDVSEANNTIQNLEEDLYNLKKQLHETNQELQHTNEELQHTNEEFEDFREQAAKELQETKEQAAKELQEAMDRIAYLQKQNADLLSCYIGHKGDNIDEALATFIQHYPEQEKMKILFLRESEGVYKFGEKRVYMKIEKGNSIKVRVGGGYMHIDEFINQYTDQEAAKIERRDVMSRFQNKLSMQKISAEQSNEAYEHSPIRLPQNPRTGMFPESPVRTQEQFPLAVSRSPTKQGKSLSRVLGQRTRNSIRNSITSSQKQLSQADEFSAENRDLA